jgi:hypothetical protein
MTKLKNCNHAINFNFHAGPGHGWLTVKRDDLLSLGLTALAISRYSHQRGGTVYLEEDCDAGYFLAALNQAGTEYRITEKSGSRSSQIRTFSCFVLTEAELKAIKASAQATWQQADSFLMETPNSNDKQGVGR